MFSIHLLCQKQFVTIFVFVCCFVILLNQTIVNVEFIWSAIMLNYLQRVLPTGNTISSSPPPHHSGTQKPKPEQGEENHFNRGHLHLAAWMSHGQYNALNKHVNNDHDVDESKN